MLLMIGFAMTRKSYVFAIAPSCYCLFLFQALKQELAYASYLNIHTAILPPPRNRDHVASYARIVNSCLNKSPYIYLSIRLPIYNPSSVFHPGSPISVFHPSSSSGVSLPNSGTISTPALVISESEQVPSTSGGSVNATWEMWDVIRSMCDYNSRLTLSICNFTFSLPRLILIA